jgi:uncharacterized protein YbbC (DUF1343 family)
VYPGIGAIEGTNISVGRGTDTPFEQIGAPWIDGVALGAALNARAPAGIRFYPVTFTPAAGAKLGGRVCHGVFMIVTDRDRLRPVRVGLEIASALSRLYGQQFKLEDAVLFGAKATLEKSAQGRIPSIGVVERRRGSGGYSREVSVVWAGWPCAVRAQRELEGTYQ